MVRWNLLGHMLLPFLAINVITITTFDFLMDRLVLCCFNCLTAGYFLGTWPFQEHLTCSFTLVLRNFKISPSIASQTAQVFVRMTLIFMPFQYLGGTHRLQCDVELLLGLGRIRVTCDATGQPIDPTTTPPPVSDKSADDWGPYGDRLQFETAEFLFHNVEIGLWGNSLQADNIGTLPPFTDHKELYKTIDATQVGDVQWESFTLKYNGEQPNFWFWPAFSLVERLLANTDFDGKFDYTPYRDFAGKEQMQCYENFMSGDWVWTQADKIAVDPSTHGSTFIPIILGNDKTTVSVETGQSDYWPVYLSISNIHNNVWHAHQNAVELLAFLAIPKMAKKYTDDPMFQHFKKQLFHSAMTRIFSSLKDGMTMPQLMKCPDHHFCHVIFGIGPYITDYLEQVLVSGIVQNCCLAFPNDLDSGGAPQTRDLTDTLADELLPAVAWNEWGVDVSIVPFTNNFPCADIHQLLAPDILHQLIKGTFKDHLVEWVGRYLELEYGKAEAKDWLADIDCCIALAPPFPGIHRFPDSCGFSQWTGDNLKALMKVYLPAIKGHVPDDMVQTFHAFLEFCYIVCQNVITDDTLKELKDTLQQFHLYRKIFQEVRVCPEGFSLPLQHALVHYEALIFLFSAPNGLCTSITESKHIMAVKKPWQHLSKHNALGQILWMNQCLAQLAVYGSPSSGKIFHYYQTCNHAKTSTALTIELGIPLLPTLITCFLAEQLQPKSEPGPPHPPPFTGHIKIFSSTIAMFVAPSDPSGIGSMHCECIHATPSWQGGPAQYDCVFVSMDDAQDGMLGMEVAQVYNFSCTLVCWFDCIIDVPDELIGMWMVAPSFPDDSLHNLTVIHVESIVCNAHLLPIFGKEYVPSLVSCHNALDIYQAFYVNHFADHHAFKLVS
ncbi:hypothetical protein EV401DRAFT_2060884 [Pisolithus croceorrhizus]|nr:hypothetical protein EV401DRAFT_2060884 [Pisolithus croceorrhizus]